MAFDGRYKLVKYAGGSLAIYLQLVFNQFQNDRREQDTACRISVFDDLTSGDRGG